MSAVKLLILTIIIDYFPYLCIVGGGATLSSGLAGLEGGGALPAGIP